MIASSNPRKYGWLVEWFDELYLVFDSIVQISHLKAYNASFAEKFYGLRRVPYTEGNPGLSVEPGTINLSNSLVLKSLVSLTLVSYFKKKLDAKYNDLNRELIDGRNKSEKRSMEQLFVDFYPFFNMTIESINLMLQVMFTVGNKQVHSLSYKLISIQLQTYSKLTQTGEMEDDDSLSWKSWIAAKWIARFFGTSLSIGAFFIQFLDYYNARESESITKSLVVKGPPPPSNSLYSRVIFYCFPKIN